jgi:hypothetical protein
MRRCEISRRDVGTIPENQFELERWRVGLAIRSDYGSTTVILNADAIHGLESAIAFLKNCRKFWTCVGERDEKKKKVRCIIGKDKVIVRPR